MLFYQIQKLRDNGTDIFELLDSRDIQRLFARFYKLAQKHPQYEADYKDKQERLNVVRNGLEQLGPERKKALCGFACTDDNTVADTKLLLEKLSEIKRH